MRIPLHKIYRAFPELDRFSDEQCEQYVLQATRVTVRRRLSRHTLEGLAVLLAFFAALFLQFLLIAVLSVIPGPRPWWLEYALALVFVSMLAGFPIMAMLIVRDQWLRRAIAFRLASARCPSCDYSLLGLPVDQGSVLCPECGSRIELEAYGLTPEHLLSEPAGEQHEEMATPSAPQGAP